MIGTGGSLVLPRRVISQPTPELVAGGDCGACVLGGILGVSIEEAYKLKGKQEAIRRGEMARLLRVAISHGLADRMIEDAAQFQSNSRHWPSFGNPAHLESLAWFNYVRMAIDAGYYGIATVDINKSGGFDTNHWISICGARTHGAISGQAITGEILINCSARTTPDLEWAEVREFLRLRGGYDLLFVRPSGLAPRVELDVTWEVTS